MQFLIFFTSACIQTVGILGPMFGFMLGSFCAKLYVDVGAVDLGNTLSSHYNQHCTQCILHTAWVSNLFQDDLSIALVDIQYTVQKSYFQTDIYIILLYCVSTKYLCRLVSSIVLETLTVLHMIILYPYNLTHMNDSFHPIMTMSWLLNVNCVKGQCLSLSLIDLPGYLCKSVLKINSVIALWFPKTLQQYILLYETCSH